MITGDLYLVTKDIFGISKIHWINYLVTKPILLSNYMRKICSVELSPIYIVIMTLTKHYKFTAAESIAWLRICRPGSVLGPQQHWLEEQQHIMWQEGDMDRARQSPQATKNFEPISSKLDDINSPHVRFSNLDLRIF